MDERPGDSWARGTELSATDQRIVDFIREGLKDAEIAVRVGISTGDVKARIERLAARLGVDGREGLRAARLASDPAVEALPTTSNRRWRAAILPAAVSGALIVGLAVGFAVGSRRDDEPSPAAAVDSTAAATNTAPAPAPTPTAAPRIEVIDGREMEYAGRLFSVPLGALPVTGTSARERLLVVTLAGNGLIRLPPGGTYRQALTSGLVLTLPLHGRQIFVQVMPSDQGTGFLLGDIDSVGVFSRSELGQPSVILRANGDGGLFHLRMNTSGELFVSVVPTTNRGTYDEWTGELIDTSGAEDIWTLSAPLAPSFFFNSCQDGPCELVISGAEMSAPSRGMVSCPQRGVWLLELASVTLTFRLVRELGNDGPGTCTPANVEEGQTFAPSDHYIVTATAPDGAPLSIAARQDGTVWVGTFRGTVGCPCLSGT